MRKKVEARIFHILEYIHHPITQKLKENIGFFSLSELEQIRSYLESGDLNYIYRFFDEKIKEYRELINFLKIQKNYDIISNIKLQEKLEIDKQEEELEMIDFNF